MITLCINVQHKILHANVCAQIGYIFTGNYNGVTCINGTRSSSVCTDIKYNIILYYIPIVTIN